MAGARRRGRVFRQAEIDQEEFAARRELEVLWLDVAMNHRRVLAVNVVQRVEQPLSPFHHLPGCERRASFIQAPSEQRAEVVAFYEIHDQELPAAFYEMVLDLRQRGMTQAGQRRGFALELLAQALPVFAEEGLFDRDRGVA